MKSISYEEAIGIFNQQKKLKLLKFRDLFKEYQEIAMSYRDKINLLTEMHNALEKPISDDELFNDVGLYGRTRYGVVTIEMIEEGFRSWHFLYGKQRSILTFANVESFDPAKIKTIAKLCTKHKCNDNYVMFNAKKDALSGDILAKMQIVSLAPYYVTGFKTDVSRAIIFFRRRINEIRDILAVIKEKVIECSKINYSYEMYNVATESTKILPPEFDDVDPKILDSLKSITDK